MFVVVFDYYYYYIFAFANRELQNSLMLRVGEVVSEKRNIIKSFFFKKLGLVGFVHVDDRSLTVVVGVLLFLTYFKIPLMMQRFAFEVL